MGKDGKEKGRKQETMTTENGEKILILCLMKVCKVTAIAETHCPRFSHLTVVGTIFPQDIVRIKRGEYDRVLLATDGRIKEMSITAFP